MPSPQSLALNVWFDKRARPIWEAYYALDRAVAQAHYDSALEDADAEPDPDLRQAKLLRLASAWLFVEAELGGPEDIRRSYEHLLEVCRIGSRGPLTERLVPLTEAMARMHADALGLAELQPLPLLRLLSTIPDEARGPNFWNLAAEWAYKHGDGQLLEDAYVYFTTQRPSVMADQMFARLRLMRGLRDGKATLQDVMETVQRMEVLAQMLDFERLLIDECRAQGLLTPDVQAEIELKKHSLEAVGRHAPVKR